MPSSTSTSYFLCFILFCVAHSNHDVFECPDKGIQELPTYNTPNLNCKNLTEECALSHQGNENLLKQIRGMKCEYHSFHPSLINLTEDILLSVLTENAATEFIERIYCVEYPYQAYFEYAKPSMFMTKLSCSNSLVKSVITKERFSKNTEEPLNSKENILRVFNPKFFNGIRSNNEPLLSVVHVERLLQIALVANDFDVDKSSDYMRSLLEGPFEKPLRTTLDQRGLYIDYEKDDKESFVHICQAFRQHLFVELKSDLGKYYDDQSVENDPKKIARLRLGWRVIEICGKIIDPEPKYLLLAILVSIFLVHLIFIAISQKMKTIKIE